MINIEFLSFTVADDGFAIERGVFAAALARYVIDGNPVVLLRHNTSMPIGTLVGLHVTRDHPFVGDFLPAPGDLENVKDPRLCPIVTCDEKHALENGGELVTKCRVLGVSLYPLAECRRNYGRNV